MIRRLSIIALPALAVVLVVAATLLPGRTKEVDSAERSPTQRSSWICATHDGLTVQAGQLAAGEEAEVVALPDGEPVDGLAEADRWRTSPPVGDAMAATQIGEGSGAVGFLTGAAGGGLVVTDCPARTDDAWFTGLGAQEDHDSVLTLVNPGPDQAVVRLSAWSEIGDVVVAGDESITVEPQEVRRIAASELAASESMLTLRVERTRGTAVAQVLDVGDGPVRGADASPAGEPARDQVVALAAGDAERKLLLTNPGEQTAHVEVSALGEENGSYVVEDMDDVSVEPGMVTAVSLPAVNAPLRLRSDVPVAAMSRTQTERDIALGGPLDDLDGQPAIAPVVSDTRLTLAASGEAVTATVEAFDADMTSLGGERIKTPAGGSASIAAAEIADDAAYLVIDSDDPGLRAQAQYVDGAEISLMELTPAPAAALAPRITWGLG